MTIEPIAIYHSALNGKFGAPRQSGLIPELKGEVQLLGEFRRSEALRGLDGFSHIWLIWGFSENRDNSFRPTVRPPRLGGNERLGVFATRSPYRPNPLGLSCVKLDSLDWSSCTIHISGADLIDGTPIFDIKPYIAYTDAHPEAAAGFTEDISWASMEVIFPEEMRKGFQPEDVEALIKILSLDPRPRYQADPERIYALTFAGRDIRFRINENGVVIVVQA